MLSLNTPHCVQWGLIQVDYILTDDMAADMFTKALPLKSYT